MDPDKLAKVLAMAESEHQGEAMSALRAARIMLSRAGLTFRDLALAAARPPGDAASQAPITTPPPSAPPAKPPPAEQMLLGLRRQVNDLEREIAVLSRQLDKAVTEAEKQREEADRWRTLARETAEKLWDLGKALERRNIRYTAVQKRRAVLELLQDPGSALLSDHEIARRVGSSPQMVSHWRRRLAIVARKLRLLPVQQRGRGLWQPGRLLQRRTPDDGRQRWIGYTPTLTIAGRGQKAVRDQGIRGPGGSHPVR